MDCELEFKKTVTKWVKRVLEKQNFVKIHVEFPDLDTTGGHVCEMTFIDVHTEKNGKSEKFQMIVKKNPAIESLTDMKLAYGNEIELYSKLVPFFEKFAKEKNTEIFDDLPYCYGTIKEKDNYVIIMENLKKQGYKIHEIKNPMDLNHVKLVLAAYGKWHAFSFAIKDQKRDEVLKDFEEAAQKCLNLKLFEYMDTTNHNELNFLIDMYKNKNKIDIAARLEKYKENYTKLVNESLKPENDDFLVVRHGDCWNNNFLFRYSKDNIPEKVSIIDWQLGFMGPPLADVTQFLFYGCSRKELEHLDELLELYYQNLSTKLRELGSDPSVCFPWDVCVKTFRKYAPAGIAGCPVIAKMSYSVDTGETYDLTDVLQDGNFNQILGELEDPEGYFQRVNGVLELCIERNLL